MMRISSHARVLGLALVSLIALASIESARVLALSIDPDAQAQHEAQAEADRKLEREARDAYLAALHAMSDKQVAAHAGVGAEARAAALEAARKKYGELSPELAALEAAFVEYRKAAQVAGVPFEEDLEAKFQARFQDKLMAEQARLEPSLEALSYGAIAVFLGVLGLALFSFVRSFQLARRLETLRAELDEN